MKGIIHRDGRFVARPTLGGRKHWLGTFDAIEDAEAAIVKWRERGHLSTANPTVTQVVDLFKRHRFDHLAPATVANYGRALTSLTAHFAGRECRTVRRIEIQEWAHESPRDYLSAARTMFRWATDMDVVADDPTRGVTAPPAPPRRKPRILSPAEVSSLADTCFEVWDEPEAAVLSAFIIFAAATGMRPGEIAALRWRDIDLTKDEITVRASISVGGEKAPKNGETRTIALTPEARGALTRLDPAGPDERTFTMPDGQLLVKATLHRYWDRVRRAAGLPDYHLYNLRHTCATRLLEAGLPSYVVAAQLGHKDGGRLVETTYGHPSHADALDKIKAATVAEHAQGPRLRVAGEAADTSGAA